MRDGFLYLIFGALMGLALALAVMCDLGHAAVMPSEYEGLARVPAQCCSSDGECSDCQKQESIRDEKPVICCFWGPVKGYFNGPCVSDDVELNVDFEHDTGYRRDSPGPCTVGTNQ